MISKEIDNAIRRAVDADKTYEKADNTLPWAHPDTDKAAGETMRADHALLKVIKKWWQDKEPVSIISQSPLPLLDTPKGVTTTTEFVCPHCGDTEGFWFTGEDTMCIECGKNVSAKEEVEVPPKEEWLPTVRTWQCWNPPYPIGSFVLYRGLRHEVIDAGSKQGARLASRPLQRKVVAATEGEDLSPVKAPSSTNEQEVLQKILDSCERMCTKHNQHGFRYGKGHWCKSCVDADAAIKKYFPGPLLDTPKGVTTTTEFVCPHCGDKEGVYFDRTVEAGSGICDRCLKCEKVVSAKEGEDISTNQRNVNTSPEHVNGADTSPVEALIHDAAGVDTYRERRPEVLRVWDIAQKLARIVEVLKLSLQYLCPPDCRKDCRPKFCGHCQFVPIAEALEEINRIAEGK